MDTDPSTETQAPPARANILLVTSTETMRQFYKGFLASRGYAVAVAASGETAIELWNRLPRKPQLLVTDLDLPGMTGRQLAASVKQLQPGIKIRFIAENGFELIDEAQSEIHDSYMIFVPFVPNSLADAVESALIGG